MSVTSSVTGESSVTGAPAVTGESNVVNSWLDQFPCGMYTLSEDGEVSYCVNWNNVTSYSLATQMANKNVFGEETEIIENFRNDMSGAVADITGSFIPKELSIFNIFYIFLVVLLMVVIYFLITGKKKY